MKADPFSIETLDIVRNIIRDSLLGNTFMTLLFVECAYIWSSLASFVPRLLLTLSFSVMLVLTAVWMFSQIRLYLLALPVHRVVSVLLTGIWLLMMEITLIFSIMNVLHRLRPL